MKQDSITLKRGTDVHSLVSIVVPCYNKEQYIGGMLKSVYNQKWDNIELVLVNDGSTDGTRNVILKWIPKLERRGYKVKLIDQENKKLPGAVKEGLIHASGEYICSIDSDDEIDPEYASTLAGFLEENPEYQWVACDMLARDKPDRSEDFTISEVMPSNHGTFHLLEDYFAMRMGLSVGHFMVRRELLARYQVIENFVTECGNQEPSFIIPLIMSGCPLKFIPKPMYINNRFAAGHSTYSSVEAGENLLTSIDKNRRMVISRLHISENDKTRLFALAEHIEIKWRFMTLYEDYYNTEQKLALSQKAVDWLDKYFNPAPCLPPDIVNKMGWPAFWEAVDARIRGEFIDFSLDVSHPIIGYGALGLVANRVFGPLLDTPLCPKILWDRAAAGVSTKNGIPVLLPDILNTDKDSTVLLMIVKPYFVKEAKAFLRNGGIYNIIDYNSILRYLASYYLGEQLNLCNFAV